MRMLVRLATAALLVAATLMVPTSGASPVSTARAADLSYFDAGNIISDAVFYDAYSMDAVAIQTFLNAKGAKCVAGEMPCLKDYAQDTADQPSDALCAGYAGTPGNAVESAARVIAQVSISCGINPRVLLVLLQKEQGLVTGSKRTAKAYAAATGFSCPDTAVCNPAFSGFASQVYFAARQFQNYKSNPTRWSFTKRVGQVVDISYYPPYNYVNNVYYGNQDNRRCGTAPVRLANIATASLYTYTPYVPDEAALAAGYAAAPGAPDVTCSAYGNRNFWNYFTDWFGSTQSTGGTAIYAKWDAQGGSSGALGRPTGALGCGLLRNGCFQHFAGGSIYWSPESGARIVANGVVRGRWIDMGWENSSLGYPIGDTFCGLAGGGCYQVFQWGSLFSATAHSRAYDIRGAIRDGWAAWNYENGPLGYPTSDQGCGLVNGGCFQYFQRGSIYWSSATGPHAVLSVVRGQYEALGAEHGTLGYPVQGTACNSSAQCSQQFQGGWLVSNPATGTHLIKGEIRNTWVANGAERGVLGYPTRGEDCRLVRGGCFELFTGGAIYWSPTTGARIVRGPMWDGWSARDYEIGKLGYPVADTWCGLVGNGCYQRFEGGSLYWSAGTGAHLVKGEIRDRWAVTGWEAGPLGYPTTDEICGLAKGGCLNIFSGGSVYWSPATGAHTVTGAIRQAWLDRGWEAGPLGYPVEEPRATAGGGAAQRFQGGTLTYDAGTQTVTVS